MSAPFSTLLLDTVAWDLVLDSSANIAVAAPPYAVSQDVACAMRLMLGELWFNAAQGVNYLGKILGHAPSLPVLQSALVTAAQTVPTVSKAACVIEAVEKRKVTGQVRWAGGSVAL